MTTPARAAAAPFHSPIGAAGDALVQDIAIIMQHFGTERPKDKNTASAQFVAGERGCLQVFSVLEMASDATDTERQERRWQTARLGVYIEKEGKKTKLFDAICTDREALKDAHPTSGLAKIPFIPSQFEPGAWSRALNTLAEGLRRMDALTPANLKDQPQPVYWHPT